MPDIDYAALAEQARKAANPVDYAALAAQARDSAASLRPEKDTLSQALDHLPMIGGALGGAIGTVGGAAVPLLNLTGVPEAAGAIAGAGLGGYAGESLRRMIEYARGTDNGKRPEMGNPILPTIAAGGDQMLAEAGGRGLSTVAGKALTKLAPYLYEAGLNRTPTMKLDFPNSAQRGVDLGLVRKGAPQKALTETEDQLTRGVLGRDLQNALEGQGRKQLPPATTPLRTGPIPTPQGGKLATEVAPVSPESDAYQNLLGQRTRPLESSGTTGRSGSRLRDDATVAPYLPIRSGEISAQAIPDVVEGAGTVRVPMATSHIPQNAGAPPGMIDPNVIAQKALGDATARTKAPNAPFRNEDLAELKGFADRFRENHPDPKTGMDTLALQRAAALRANWRAPEPGKQAENAFMQGITNASRNEVGNLNPDLWGQLRKEQDLLGLVKANEHDSGPSQARHLAAVVAATMGAGAGHAMGIDPITAAILGGGFAEGVRTPAIMKPLGIASDRAGKALLSPWVKNMLAPNALRAAILGGEEQK